MSICTVVRMDLQAIGHTIRHHRESVKLSMRAAAVLGDVSPTTWSELERGLQEPSLATQRGVAAALGWRLDWFDELALDPHADVVQPDAAGRDYLGREVALSDAYIDRLTDVISRRAIGALAEQLRELSENLRAVMGRIERLERRGGEHGAR